MSASTNKRTATLLLIILVVLGGYGFFSSSLFAIRKITVIGNGYYSRDRLIAQSGISTGDNIFVCDTKLARRNLTRLSFIGQATVERVLPDQVVIRVKEVHPVAMISRGSSFLGVSETGQVLGQLPADYLTLPVITGFDNLNAGDRDTTLGMIASVLQRLDPIVLAGVSELFLENRRDLILVTTDLIYVNLGDESNLDKKVQVLNALLLDVWERDLKVAQVNLSVYDNPVIRYR
ncbi:MAG: FtsQ-type POTRA domain-containing protein [Firmicutes bacterium]|nr:FtsQ-type POTRA domain-containing protein [Bacillota bacterium]